MWQTTICLVWSTTYCKTNVTQTNTNEIRENEKLFTKHATQHAHYGALND